MVMYEYPPSRHMQSFAPFDQDSHYFASGQAEFDELKVECDFEVIYTHNCEPIVALYLKSKDAMELFWRKHIEEKGNTHHTMGGPIPHPTFTRLSGIDKRFGYEIIVENGHLQSLGGSEIPPTFAANTIYRIDRRSTITKNYSYKEHFVFELTGIDFETDFLYELQFPISDEKTPLTLQVIYKQVRLYDNQPLVRLLIPKNSVPDQWDSESLADLWCAFVSLAIGRDVRWVEMENPTDESITVKWQYRNNVFGTRSFTGLISTLPLRLDSEPTTEFLRRCFAKVQSGEITSELASKYTLAIRHYITYRMLRHRPEDEARLIGTTVEELLTIWEVSQNIQTETHATFEEANGLWKAMQQAAYNHINTFPNDNQRRRKIKDRLSYLVRQELPRFRFEDRLERYFEHVILGMPEGWYEANVSIGLPYFVTTRDHVVHTGRFQTEEPKIKNWHYFNLLMMLPLMVFALFHFDEEFIDLREYWQDAAEAPPNEQENNIEENVDD